jgi:hypothetical protein
MYIQDWVNVIVASMQNLWLQVVSFLPQLIGAFVVFLVGLIVATGIEKLVERVLFYLKIDKGLKKVGVDKQMNRMKVRLNTGHFFGRVVFWFIVIAFLLAASDILRFSALSGFLRDVLNYIPNVFIAALILLATLYVAHFLRALVVASVLSTGTYRTAAKTISVVAWWGVVVFGFLAALIQLNVARDVITALVYGLIIMLSLAGGLAFGLGGREYAARLLGKFEDSVTHKE